MRLGIASIGILENGKNKNKVNGILGNWKFGQKRIELKEMEFGKQRNN